MNISPAYPKTGEIVTISVSSYSLDMNRATITWYVNGVWDSQGIANTSIRITAGTAGKTTTVRSVISVDGETVEKTMRFTPGGVDLIWEAYESYTPPFYRGKALPIPNASVKIVAVPHLITSNGSELSTDTLTYTWKKNGFYRDVQDQSGYGKDELYILKDILLDTEIVTVEVSSTGRSLQASDSVEIPETQPEINLYQRHPLYGTLYNNSLNSSPNFQPGNETILVAEPYFFSVDNNDPVNLSFNWTIGGVAATPNWDTPNVITIDTPETFSGSTALSLSVEAPQRILQNLTETFSLIFKNTETSTFF